MLAAHGFVRDPFASTNADQEPELSDYFVSPPYFASVVGDKQRPGSAIVFAPRGAGKTAQRKMLELEDVGVGGVLAVVYDEFGMTGRTRKHLDLATHLTGIAQRLALRLLVEMEADDDVIAKLSVAQRRGFRRLVTELLGQMSAAEYAQAMRSLATPGERVTEFVDRYGSVIGPLINAVLKKLGLDSDLEVPDVETEQLDSSPLLKLEYLTRIALDIGFVSVYVLVDRVDELQSTSQDPKAAFELIESLLMDLPVLEMGGVGYKFFLWDQTEDHFDGAGGRRDRVVVHTLDWKRSELVRMLNGRLHAHSGGRISSLNQITDESVEFDLDLLVSILAVGSPRDMIRLADRIVAEQTRDAPEARRLDYRAVMSGLRTFADERAVELFSGDIKQFKRVRSPVFTNKDIQRLFKIQVASARNKITGWARSGLVDKVGESEEQIGAGRREFVYGVLDPRLAIAVNPHKPVDEVLADLLFPCPDCGTVAATDRESAQCFDCSNVFETDSVVSVYEYIHQAPDGAT